MTLETIEIPTAEDIERAASRLVSQAHRTPVFTSRSVDQRVGARVFFKCENLQRAGAFKFRGAYNTLAQLPAAERRRGVLAYSSGNHAQAVALAGSFLGIPATIVMPNDAPSVKLQATRAYGGDVVLYDRATTDREALGQHLAKERGLTIVPPYDHSQIVAGQGTVAKELFEETGQLDLLLTPCGGGGLLSGSAIAAATWSPACHVIGVEPATADDAARSFRTKTLQTVHNPETIADGARTPSLGRITFAAVMQYVADIITVDDDEIVRAMRYLAERMKIVVEPTGAMAAAAVLEGRIDVEGRRVGIILSGGNVDLAQASRWFA